MKKPGIRERLAGFNFKDFDARILSFLALFIAFTSVATYLHIPGPSSSYFNLGEVAIYIIALTFGARAGAVAGGLGSALVDVLLGYSIWAPFTLIIKGLEGYVVGKIAREGSWKFNIAAIVTGGNIMVLGYALTKGFLISWPAVLPEIGIDYGQMLIGGAVALPISYQLNNYFASLDK
uniref:Integral membrane protein n=1 Tax=uncultured organism TaxID=155900 RepID=M1PWI8_9ZZZZ|nr:integral membrane protein [uncultured organism]